MTNSTLPPGPRFSWLDTWRFVQRPRQYYAWLRRNYGAVVTLPTPHATLVVALTSEGARQVFTADPDKFAAFQKEAFGGLAGIGSLWVLDGSAHRRERRLLSPPFHVQRVRTYGEAIREITRLHTNKWQPGQEIRAYSAMLDISRDVILQTVFGVENGSILDEGRQVLAALLHSVHPMIAFIPAFQSWWFPPWLRYQRAKKNFSRFVVRCVSERRASSRESQDLLGLLLAARYEDGSPMGDPEIRDELLTILLSGHETTAVALSWALYELARHPDVLQRLRHELEVLGPDPYPDVIARQAYLSAVCDETLRLHTILTEIARTTRVPFELLGYTIPAGTGVAVGICAIHQDPVLYSEPDRFMPERFLGRSYSPFEFLPFGGGNRRCLGAAFSDYAMRITLATIAAGWELQPFGEEREIRHNIATGPKHGVRMIVKGSRDNAWLRMRAQPTGAPN